MGNPSLTIEVEHASTLCLAMQQNAVRWLHALAVRNDSDRAFADIELRVELGDLLEPVVIRIDELPAGARLEPSLPDLVLMADAFVDVIERTRTDLVITVTVAGAGKEAVLAREVRPLHVLAYNEWPGLQDMPGLLLAFVLPNHPALTPVLHGVANRLQRSTGDAALNGYQSGDPDRVRAILMAVHDTLCAVGIRYVSPPPSFERAGQKIRMPEQVLGERLATCLDLAVLYAAILEHIGLQPFVVLQREHALCGVWLNPEDREQVAFGPGLELRKGAAAGTLEWIECTVVCVEPKQSAQRALEAAARRMADDSQFRTALDVTAARRAGVRPLPLRASNHAVLPHEGVDIDVDPATNATAPVLPDSAPTVQVVSAGGVLHEPIPDSKGPADRLEHWQQKLLDLSMFNRLLNFVETKKTVRLCAHDLSTVEDRLQSQARMRVHSKPELFGDNDPRDPELAEQSAGQDVMAEYLAEELRAGRWRCELGDEQLGDRLTEIFRHARTSLEESGANTLYLGIGFLRWFETPESKKPRRAPLLLLPLVIERLSVQEGYRFVMDDAEARINTTLLQMLERDFDLRVPIGETLPEDDRGVDVEAVLNVFRKVAVAMPRWEVEDVGCIGFFSFTKYLMWLDLKNREQLMQSAVLRHLVEAPGSSLPQDVPEVGRDELDDLDPETVFCPKDADSSQLSAVMAGSAGRSFVLEGPPGTGKSQTITNLIAQSLANGKRVLFVAEKRAALEVVHERLTDVGLAPFCLELHSRKSGPKAVLEQLRGTLELGHRRAPSEWHRVAAELQQRRTELNDFVLSLHRRREHGWSVHQAMAQLVHLRDAPRVPLSELLQREPEQVAQAREALDALIGCAGTLPVPQQAPWWGVQRGDWTPAMTRDAAPMVARLRAATDAMRDRLQPILAALALPDAVAAGPSHDQIATLLELLHAMQAPSLPPGAWLRRSNWREFDEELERCASIGVRRDELWQALEPRWRRDVLALDLGSLAASYRLHAESFVLFRWWRLRKLKPVLASVATSALGSAVSVRDDLEAALRVRDEERLLQSCAVAREGLASMWHEGLADWSAIQRSQQQARELRRLLLQLEPDSLQPDEGVLAAVADHLDALADGESPLPSHCGELFAAHDEFVAARSVLQGHLDLSLDDAFGEPGQPGYLRVVAERTHGWQQHEPALRDHCAYRRTACLAEQLSLGSLVTAHATGELATHELRAAFDRSLYEGWLDEVHTQEPALARFRGQDHEAAIARFAELDRQAIVLGAKVVVARLAATLPQLRDTRVASSELGLLERELKKQRRHKPVRRLLSEIRGLWPRLSPCVLMSPLSVAQFLSRDAHRFDLVVFDEASQIPMWDAVGAIGRGESLIVVGDSRQLPPTNFFQRMAQGDDPEVDEIPEDLESVLDECGAAGLPRMHLDWHYRSRHESLIAFSNHYYYQNRLLTFPAPRAASDGAGVRCVRVDGVYDRAGSQQNRIEAEALVAAVVARLQDPILAQRSIGIVTFSRAQQTLIEDLLDAARRADPSLEAALLAADEELFVKNLENVQGDERDVILFSICYGPDAAGKIYENYGPLNQQGGERRLNVAVTRARRELVVFTSVGPEQIANRTNATGARHLRYFLDYAIRGEAALIGAVERDPSREVDSPFEAAVRDELQKRGHEVHTQVGCSGYRIDLAVVDPEAPGRYLLGIECDGATYHRAATARDRDRLRASVLRGLGWRLERVWSTDFWQDPKGELDSLEGAIEEARVALIAEPVGASSDEPESEPEVESEPVQEAAPVPREPPIAGGESSVDVASAPHEPPADPDGPRPYHPLQIDEVPQDRELAEHLLRAESPMVFDRFARSLAEAWDVSRVTERVRQRVRAALPEDAVDDGGVLWADAAMRDRFCGFRVAGDGVEARGIDELPAIEVQNAMAWLLRQHQALSGDDLARETARCFGIQRLGSVVREVTGLALDELIARGACSRDGDLVRRTDS